MAISEKRIGILLEFNCEDAEVIYPLYRFREYGWKTLTIGPEAGKMYKCKNGYPCKSDLSIDDVATTDLDALVIPGGFAPDYWRRDKRFCGLTAKLLAEGKPVAAICHGPWLLISAKVLKGRRATCFHSIKDDVENAGATYLDEACVVDGNLITSRTPNDLPDFCKAIAAQLGA